ncbi:MAG: DNA replication/repair protein RecF [Clostridia bacterium]|nr:DNA replication/repair protein RecF [Clostridia bacterium]
MKVDSLILKDFRNYEGIEISPGSGMNVFIGSNAQGKTNIIEALHLCCVGRRLRTSRDEEMIRWEQSFGRVTVTSSQQDGTHAVTIILARGQKKKKNIKIGERKAERIGELFGHVCGVLFSPEDLEIIKGGPAERRRFLDMLLSQISTVYFYHLQRYTKTLSERNAVLREIAFKPELRNTLDMWDDLLAESGAAVAARRLEAIEHLSKLASEEHRNLTQAKEELNLRYITTFKDPQDIKNLFLEQLFASREDDIRRQTTSCGVHRDDISIRINGKETRIYGSQGQQRSAVLSLKMAQLAYMAEYKGENPILLLDDVMSELDLNRRRALGERINRIQTFVTCTDISDLGDTTQGMLYSVEKGTLRQIDS